MAVTRSKKEEALSELTDKMQNASSLIFAHYIGMDVATVSDFRNKLREEKAEMKVAKKTLMKIAAQNAGYPELDEKMLDGPVACIFSYEDPISGAQVAFKFGKKNEQVKLIGGVFDKRVLNKQQAVEFASLPTRIEMLAKFLGMVRSPLVSFASMSNSPLTGFARALSEVAKKKEA